MGGLNKENIPHSAVTGKSRVPGLPSMSLAESTGVHWRHTHTIERALSNFRSTSCEKLDLIWLMEFGTIYTGSSSQWVGKGGWTMRSCQKRIHTCCPSAKAMMAGDLCSAGLYIWSCGRYYEEDSSLCVDSSDSCFAVIRCKRLCSELQGSQGRWVPAAESSVSSS